MKDLVTQLLGVVRSLGWMGAAALSVGLAVSSLGLAAVIVANWPVNQFAGDEPPPFWHGRHPVIRALGLVGKNIVGYVTVCLGVVLALPGVPGQGVVLILIGLTMLNFPGKRRLEKKLIGRPSVLRVVNRLRQRLKRAPLQMD